VSQIGRDRFTIIYDNGLNLTIGCCSDEADMSPDLQRILRQIKIYIK